MTGTWDHATTVQEHRIADLADQFGTPLYLYDGDVLRGVYERLRARLHSGVDIFYSAKANPNLAVCSVLRSLGAGIEVSSLAELVTAVRAGADPDDIIFVGPGKSAAELAACIEHGIHAVVCESLDELTALDTIAPSSGVSAMLRVNPAFTGQGSRLSMGGKPRQFGIDEEILTGADAVLRSLHRVRVVGVHAYLGTRVLDASAVVHNTRGVLEVAGRLADTLDIPLRTVDIGGGFGVPYFDNEKDLDVDEAVAGVNQAVSDFLAQRPGTRMITELGRYLTGWAGTYVVRVRYVKQSRDERFVVTDGGTNHHMAAVGIGSFVKRNFPLTAVTRPQAPAAETCTVTGPLCTPNDVIAKQVPLPEVEPGDLLAVARSGAYGPSASPVLFLGHGHPAEVLVDKGVPHLVRRRDTVEDLLAPQHGITS